MSLQSKTRDRAYLRYVRRKAIRRRKYINDHVYSGRRERYCKCDGRYAKDGIPNKHFSRCINRRDEYLRINEAQQRAELQEV